MDQQGALERHPELAQLWTLHFAGRMALRSLEAAPKVGPAWLAQPIREQLTRSVEELLEAIERYKDVVQLAPAEQLRVSIPDSWSAEQADTVLARLDDVAGTVVRVPRGKSSRSR